MMSSVAGFGDLPLVGRTVELEVVRSVLAAADDGVGTTLLLRGEAGVGKTRLARYAEDEARRRGFTVATGRAYPVETGVPYALFSDALRPLLAELETTAVTALTRGAPELAQILPSLPAASHATAAGDDPVELRQRMLWNFAQFLKRLASLRPLIIVLEDLQWADASSLELLHFSARQTRSDRVVLLGTCRTEGERTNRSLRDLERLVVTAAAGRVDELGALGLEETAALVDAALGSGAAAESAGELAALLHGWTRGNPFFLIETLKELLRSGGLRAAGAGWTARAFRELTPPRSIREAVSDRTGRLTPDARSVAELACVIGAHITFDVLLLVAALDESDLLSAVEELVEEHVLEERLEGSAIAYDFVHPLVQDTVYAGLGLARARILHRTVAESLERFWGDAAERHADELAYHFTHGGGGLAGHGEKAARYLAAAGRHAVARNADREAVDYLQAALRVGGKDAEGVGELRPELAHALQRLGHLDEARELWEELRDEAVESRDPAAAMAAERRIALALLSAGRQREALGVLDEALRRSAGLPEPAIRVHVMRATVLQELGRPDDSRVALQAALDLLPAGAGAALRARVHRGFLLLYTWTGPARLAREHGDIAARHAEETGDPSLVFSVQRALAAFSGLTGDTAALAEHLAAAERIAEELHSPLLRLLTAEIAVELSSVRGDWESGLAQAREALEVARALNQRSLLPRLLVWTGLIHVGRDEMDAAETCIDEAWELAGCNQLNGTAPAADRRSEAEEVVGRGIHSIVPAHIGRAGLLCARGEYREAIRVGENGLRIADSSGYAAWAIHRLLPIIAESYVYLRDLRGAAATGARLRAESERFNHELGLAWADACEAIVAWLGGDSEKGAVLLRAAVERLEAVPHLPDATRLRRQLAGRLAELGDREGAVRELRRVHDVLLRLGARRELDKVREQFRELGARPPRRSGRAGAGSLTAREVEVARLVGRRLSNKAIARELDVSPRTVTTHVANIFRKVGVTSRGQLVDLIREGFLERATRPSPQT